MRAPSDPRLVRLERGAVIEWITYRRRLVIAAGFMLALLVTIAIWIAWDVGVGHLNQKQLRRYVHERRLNQRGLEGPILERVPAERSGAR